MIKEKKALITIAIISGIAILFLLQFLPPPVTNGSPIKPNGIRRIPLGELIHTDHNGYHHYYYHDYFTNYVSSFAYIGHLALAGTRGGMSNTVCAIGYGYILDIGTKQYKVVNFAHTWIELEELG